ncbi:MAG: beta-ketoacyl-[acyl-carrier-protein] synthase family protein [Polyangiaceae bacterium]
MTGVGMTTALGATADETFQNLVAGRSGIGPMSLFDTTGYRTSLGAVAVADVATLRNLVADGAPASRSTWLAWLAAKEALAHAGLDPSSARVGLVIGGTTGGMLENEALLAELHAAPDKRDAPTTILAHPLTSTGDFLAHVLGPFAHVRSLCSACSSGANALATASHWLLSGEVDAVLAGGTDALCRLTYSGFNALASLDVAPCRPFDVSRAGLTLGEGAGFLVLERSSRARSRNREPVAEFVGHAMGAEAHHITNPEAAGTTVARLVTRTLLRAGVTADDLDYVNAHGTGTPLNDAMESAGLRQALGTGIDRVPVSSSKGQIGHTLGAAGAIEAVIASLVVRDQTLVPTANLVSIDPECRLVHVRDRGRKERVRLALSNSFGFGGMDGVVAFAVPEYCPPKRHVPKRVIVTGATTITPSRLASNAAIVPVDSGPPGPPATTLPTTFDADLDKARSRRLDRPARLGVVAAEGALRAASAGASDVERSDLGVVLGSAFGSVDASAAFMMRLFERGPRLASPAEFPNLVPSSPVGHASIYLGARGPAFAVADLSASGEAAVLEAVCRVAVGDAPAVVAGAFEETSTIVDRIFRDRFDVAPGTPRAPRSEGAAALVVEDEDVARAAGRKALARFVWGSRDASLDALFARLPAPRGRSRVFVARDLDDVTRAVVASSWAPDSGGPATVSTESAVGDHEAAGAHAIAWAVATIARGDVDSALVVGRAPARSFALVFEAP